MAPERILVIEDDPDVSDTLCTALSSMFSKAKITALASGEEFTQVFDTENAAVWDLVILDLMLPGLSGVEMCRRIRASIGGDTVPVLAMTGYDTPEMEERIRGAGASGYMAKPFEIADFKKSVLELLK